MIEREYTTANQQSGSNNPQQELASSILQVQKDFQRYIDNTREAKANRAVGWPDSEVQIDRVIGKKRYEVSQRKGEHDTNTHVAVFDAYKEHILETYHARTSNGVKPLEGSIFYCEEESFTPETVVFNRQEFVEKMGETLRLLRRRGGGSNNPINK